MSERDDLSRDYDDLELNLTEQQKLVSAARKENKALSAEIQELKAAAANAGSSSSSGLGTKGRMAAAAAAAAGAGAALSRAADRSSGSSGGGSAEEERLREECGLLTLQLEDLRAECDEKLAAERKLRAALQSQILQLRSETDSLRSREVRFADLSVIKSHLDPKKNSKDKLQMDLIDAYESMRARDKFLEGQIKEADATLTNAKNGWIQTISLLQDQVASLEAEVAELKGALENTNKDKPFDQQQFELVQKQLRKVNGCCASHSATQTRGSPHAPVTCVLPSHILLSYRGVLYVCVLVRASPREADGARRRRRSRSGPQEARAQDSAPIFDRVAVREQTNQGGLGAQWAGTQDYR